MYITHNLRSDGGGLGFEAGTDLLEIPGSEEGLPCGSLTLYPTVKEDNDVLTQLVEAKEVWFEGHSNGVNVVYKTEDGTGGIGVIAQSADDTQVCDGMYPNPNTTLIVTRVEDDGVKLGYKSALKHIQDTKKKVEKEAEEEKKKPLNFYEMGVKDLMTYAAENEIDVSKAKGKSKPFLLDLIINHSK